MKSEKVSKLSVDLLILFDTVTPQQDSNEMKEWTNIQLEVPTANRIRKAAIDTGEEIRDLATRVVQKGLPLVLDEIRSSRRDNTTAPQ